MKSKKILNLTILASITTNLFLIFILPTSLATSPVLTETQITSETNAEDPVIYGNKLIWTDFRDLKETVLPDGDIVGSSDGDIYMYDLSTLKETRITTSYSAYYPDIYGDRIVWADDRNGDTNVYLCSISGENITLKPSEQDSRHEKVNNMPDFEIIYGSFCLIGVSLFYRVKKKYSR